MKKVKLKLMSETSQEQLLKHISAFLEENKIPYMITGAWSVIYYARPRASHDIDFIVEIGKKEVERVLQAFRKLSLEYIVDTKAIKQATLAKDMFNIVHLPTMLKLDFWLLKDESFDKTRFRRRKKVKLLGGLMSIATAEDTILKKLAGYKQSKLEKHLVDAAFVYQIQKENLDKKYLDKWIKAFGLTGLFRKLAKIDLEEYI